MTTVPSTISLLVSRKLKARTAEIRAERLRLAAVRRASRGGWVALASLGMISPKFLDWLEQYDSRTWLDDTYEPRDIPTSVDLLFAKGIPEFQIPLRDILPAGVDPDNIPWLPKDCSMFPRSEPDKVHMDGKVYSQAYGQILFELPSENNSLPQTSGYHYGDNHLRSYKTEREAPGQKATDSDNHDETYEDGAASDYYCTCGPCKRAGY
ncbi:hypothetical protein FRC12_018732 [Ceratobasidium sp. 428]|nr:hypothetical protein FRC09_005928 [Ceratobasidium sp. 395]KAG8784419.1 hypothetical protein FRC12_018732 [Ceratobasidium sp. 428]